jgi:hypothetical protein
MVSPVTTLTGTIEFNKREVLSKETTPLAGVALSLYADIYFVVKMNFVLRYITVNRIINEKGPLKSS